MQGEHDSHHNKVISLSPSVNTANQYIRVIESVICRLTVTLESATIASTTERPWRTRWRRFHALARVATHPYSATTGRAEVPLGIFLPRTKSDMVGSWISFCFSGADFLRVPLKNLSEKTLSDETHKEKLKTWIDFTFTFLSRPLRPTDWLGIRRKESKHK